MMRSSQYQTIDDGEQSASFGWSRPLAACSAALVLFAVSSTGHAAGRSIGSSLYSAGLALERMESSATPELSASVVSECGCDCAREESESLAVPVPFPVYEPVVYIQPTEAPTATRLWDLYWTDGLEGDVDESYVWTTDEYDEGIKATVLVDTLGTARGIDIDTNGTTVYFAGDGCIAKVDVDGYNLDTLVCYTETTGTDMQGIAVYEAANSIYWVDYSTGILWSTELSGGTHTMTVVYDGFTNPIDVAIDETAGKLYVSDADGVHRMDLDASDLETVLGASNTNFESFYGLDIDADNRELYFIADSGLYAASVSNLDEIWALYTGLSGPMGVAVNGAEHMVFWSDETGIYRGTSSAHGQDEFAKVTVAFIDDARFVAILSEVSPTPAPTSVPTSDPSFAPTFTPSIPPVPLPTSRPSGAPTSAPSSAPVPVPSRAPSPSPSVQPSPSPSVLPSPMPIPTPSAMPSKAPNPVPTSVPVPLPSLAPTSEPSVAPTSAPTTQCFHWMVTCDSCDGSAGYECEKTPTVKPSEAPTVKPTVAPTAYGKGLVTSVRASSGGCLDSFELGLETGGESVAGVEGGTLSATTYLDTHTEFISKIVQYGGCGDYMGGGVTFTVSSIDTGEVTKTLVYAGENQDSDVLLYSSDEISWPCQIIGVTTDDESLDTITKVTTNCDGTARRI